MVCHRHDCLRRKYTAEVTSALSDYVMNGGLFSFQSEGGPGMALTIHFSLDDGALYDSLLRDRLDVAPWIAPPLMGA